MSLVEFGEGVPVRSPGWSVITSQANREGYNKKRKVVNTYPARQT